MSVIASLAAAASSVPFFIAVERTPLPNRLREDEAVAGTGGGVCQHRSRIDATGDGQPVFHLVVHDGVAANHVGAGFVDLVLTAAKDLRQHGQRELPRGKGRDVHCGERRPAHRIDVGQRVRGGHLSKLVGVVDDGCKEVDRLHEHDVVGHAKDARVIERLVPDENARIRLSRQRRERVRQVRRTHLRRSASAARELCQAEDLGSRVRHVTAP
jgi:hypothetical protein